MYDYAKVPEVKRCCFCFPLRQGIIVFGVINTLLTVFAVACLVITTELRKLTITDGSSLEEVTSAILFGILGMCVILNILLLVAGCQKDIAMLRLYNRYVVATTLAALLPTFVLLSRLRTVEVCSALVAIVIQCYIIVLVRSEILKLEKQKADMDTPRVESVIVDMPDRDTLL